MRPTITKTIQEPAEQRRKVTFLTCPKSEAELLSALEKSHDRQTLIVPVYLHKVLIRHGLLGFHFFPSGGFQYYRLRLYCYVDTKRKT